MLKIADTESRKIFITSDLHLNHNKEFVWKYRGYESLGDHNDSIIAKINEVCRPCDLLINLGDFCLNTKIDEFYDFVRRINPKMIFQTGNHGNPWIKVYKEFSYLNYNCLALGVDWIGKITYWGDYLELVWNKQFIVCSHFPLLVFNNSKFGAWHVHGHCHGKLKSSLPESQDGKILDVGWDVFKKPIDFDELKSIMGDKNQKSNDGLH